ncbi:MAG: glycosyltransferase family 2 protein [Fusobacteriaceae bacterium]
MYNIPKIAGVVVLYHPEEDLKININSYLSKIEKLWIIDNTPNNQKFNLFEMDNPKIVYKNFNENMGIAYALNFAAKQAFEENFEWLLTMDQDSKFQNGSLEELIKTLKIKSNEKNIGIISPYHYLEGIENNELNDIFLKETVMTSGNLVNLEILNLNGYFLDKLFIDEVDHEYCYRLKAHGYKVYQNNRSVLKHNLGEIKIYNILGFKVVVTNHSWIRHYYMARNKIYIIKKYSNKFFEYIKTLVFIILKVILFEDNKMKKIKYIAV